MLFLFLSPNEMVRLRNLLIGNIWKFYCACKPAITKLNVDLGFCITNANSTTTLRNRLYLSYVRNLLSVRLTLESEESTREKLN